MRRAPILLGTLLAAGCTVGPNYKPPAPEIPAQFAEPHSSSPAAPMDLAAWWKAFNDPELDRLIDLALAGSLDIQAAASRIRQARAEEIAARAGGLPELDASGTVTRTKLSKNSGLSSLSKLFGGGNAPGGGSAGQGGIGIPGDTITTYAAGFDASWELDIFGGNRRALEGARARTEAAIWDSRDATVSLSAEVADAYLQFRLAQQREAVARNEIARQTRSLQILSNSFKVGLVPEGDTIRQRAQLAIAQASIEPLIAEQRMQMHSIGILIGRAPDSVVAELSRPLAQPRQHLAIPPGLPSDLLRRRPDLRVAERNLAAATADIGVAVADLYPKFSLTGMAQLISTALSSLFESDSLQLTGSGMANFPILDFGRRRSRVTVREEQARQAYYRYRETVLLALRDVEDALIRIATEQRRNASLTSGVADANRALHAVRARYDSGLVDLSAVLDAQASVFQQQDLLAQSDYSLRRDTVSLYKALGGGWSDTASQ